MKTVFLPAKDAVSRAINWLSTSIQNIWARISTAEDKIDALEGDYLPRSGGEISGPIFYDTNPTHDDHLSRKAYVDAVASGAGGGYLPLTGGTLEGLVAFAGYIPSCTADPSTANHLVRMGYLPTAYVARSGATASYMTGDLHMGYDDPGPPPSASRNQVKHVADATDNYDAVNLSQANGLYLPLSGGTVSGDILRAADPSTANALSRRSYVDAQRDTRLALAGGTLEGLVAFAGHLPSCTATPTTADHLTRKGYVDTVCTPPVDAVIYWGRNAFGVNASADTWTEIARVDVNFPTTTANALVSIQCVAGYTHADTSSHDAEIVIDPDGTPDYYEDQSMGCWAPTTASGGSVRTPFGPITWATEVTGYSGVTTISFGVRFNDGTGHVFPSSTITVTVVP